MELLNTFGKWASDGTLVKIGVILLVSVFIVCFFFKTFWGDWKGGAKTD